MAQIATIIGVISLVGCILLYIIRGSGPDTIEGTRHAAEDKGIDTPLRPPALPKQDGKRILHVLILHHIQSVQYADVIIYMAANRWYFEMEQGGDASMDTDMIYKEVRVV